jgi:hypothetical protein
VGGLGHEGIRDATTATITKISRQKSHRRQDLFVIGVFFVLIVLDA